jgi:hypothetical protein
MKSLLHFSSVYEEGPFSCIIVMHNFACVKSGHFEKCNTPLYGHYILLSASITAPTCKASIISLEPCALNDDFSAFHSQI